MKKKCSIRGCKNLSNSKGWCKPHYDAWSRSGDPKSYRGDRSHLSLWDKVSEIGWTKNKETKCKEWNGFRNELGYGLYRNGNDPLRRVHRIVMERKIGRSLLRSEHVLHKCDNPCCGNILHLRIGTPRDNMQDMWQKRRGFSSSWTHCPNGHKYPENRPVGIEKNRCRECANERNRRYSRSQVSRKA
jgi:hypothetical protein